MALMIVGLILFFGIHLVPSTPLRGAMVARMGEDPFKGMFSLVALVGFGLIVYGFSQTEFVALLNPQSWGRSAAYVLMPVAMILLVASNTPNNLKRFVRHPMLIGVTLWAATHVAANGDLASTLLFLCFGVFALLDIVLVETGGRYKAAEPVSVGWDVATVAIGLLVAALVFYFHEYVSGVPLVAG